VVMDQTVRNRAFSRISQVPPPPPPCPDRKPQVKED